MKKFVIQFSIAVILISMGVAMSFFELQEYEVKEGYQELSGYERVEAQISKDDPLRIRLKEEVPVHYIYDATKDGSATIEIANSIEYDFQDNELVIKDWYYQHASVKQYLDTFLTGLKHHTLYTFHHDVDDFKMGVTIICSKEQKEWITEIR